jgi:hypothetical protein
MGNGAAPHGDTRVKRGTLTRVQLPSYPRVDAVTRNGDVRVDSGQRPFC